MPARRGEPPAASAMVVARRPTQVREPAGQVGVRGVSAEECGKPRLRDANLDASGAWHGKRAMWPSYQAPSEPMESV